jgi:starvation-inducible DNA-binding protein
VSGQFSPKPSSAHIRRLCRGKGKPGMSREGNETQHETLFSTQAPTAVDMTRDISGALNALLADAFAVYLKTKNFHWHVNGPHFYDYQLMLDEQGKQIFAITAPIAERVRKIGGTTLRSISHIARLQRVLDNDADYVTPTDMLKELREDNIQFAARMREAHRLCNEHGDVASLSLLETWINEAEGRAWFLFEVTRPAECIA